MGQVLSLGIRLEMVKLIRGEIVRVTQSKCDYWQFGRVLPKRAVGSMIRHHIADRSTALVVTTLGVTCETEDSHGKILYLSCFINCIGGCVTQYMPWTS